MSRLNELVAELCPDGVEYKALGDVATLTDGSHSSPKATTNGHPMPSVKDMRFSGFDFTSCKRIGDDDYELLCRNGCQPKKNDVLIAKDGSVLKHAFAVHEECDYVVLSSIAIVRPDVEQMDSDFLAYYFRTYSVQTLALRKYVSKSGVPRIILRNFKLIRIPVPPIEVQREIVRILDSFQELDETLTAEIEAREKQLDETRDYYTNPDKLKRRGVSFEMQRLGQIGSMAMCKRVMKHQTSPIGDIPFYKIGTFGGQADAYISRELFEEYKRRYRFPRKGAILISASGTIGRTVVYDGEDAFFQDSNIVWLDHDESRVLNPYLQMLYRRSPWYVAEGGVIKRLYTKNVEMAEVAVPSLGYQRDVVSIVSDAECYVSLLRSERDARRKQFAYYRDKLLDLPEKVTTNG